jgi:imidazole glycerol-phosphate synthase subunit HisH
MKHRVTVVDYGMCNMLNVARAFQHLGADPLITEDPADVGRAEMLVVPGVGAFEDSIREVVSRGFADAICRFSESGRPMLGICVGMQILFEASEEFGLHKGLGILRGRVKAIPSIATDGTPLRVPHIGWNHLVPPESGRTWGDTVLAPLTHENPAVYFVHSFAAEPDDQSIRLADCQYGGNRICAAIQRGNMVATQFHPERSGTVGLSIIQQFLDL